MLFVHFGEAWIRGSERMLLDTLAHLDRKRFAPSLWCNSEGVAAAAGDQAISVRRSDFQFYFHPDSPRFSWQTYRGLVTNACEIITSCNAKIIHANSAAPTQFMLPAARLCNIPILTQLHTRYLRRCRYITGLHLVDQLVGVSRTITDDLLGDGISPSKVSVIPNGVDPVRLATGDRRTLRAELGIGAGDVVVAIVGSLIPRKGHDILLAALHQIDRTKSKIQVLVVGDGPDRAQLQIAAAGLPVHFLGVCNDVGAIFRDAVDIVVVPSRQEAFGLVIAEAALFGVPAIGARTGGIPDIIRADETGVLIPPGDAERLARAITQLATNASLRYNMGDAARQYVTANFSIEQTVRRLERSYDNTIEHHAKDGWLRGVAWRPYWRLARTLTSR